MGSCVPKHVCYLWPYRKAVSLRLTQFSNLCASEGSLQLVHGRFVLYVCVCACARVHAGSVACLSVLPEIFYGG